jgi:hypothetical protein
MGYWPMTMRMSNFVIWPCSLTNCQQGSWPRTVKSEIYQKLNWFASLLASRVNFLQQRNKMLDTKYSINNSWRKFKRKECLINVCKSSDKRFVNCPHLHKLQLRFSRLRQCLFLKLLRQWTHILHMMGRLLSTLKHEHRPMFIWYTNSRHYPQF